jgi:hypothetical protein
VGLWRLRWTQEHKRRHGDVSWFRLSELYIRQWLFFIFESSQIGGYNERERFGRGSLSAILGSLAVRFLPRRGRRMLLSLAGLHRGGMLCHSSSRLALLLGQARNALSRSLCSVLLYISVYRIRPPPYKPRKIRYKVVQGFSLWSTCVRVQDGAIVAWMDPDVVVKSGEPRVLPDSACPDALTVRVVCLNQPPPGEPSRGFLGDEDIWLGGLTSGPRNPRPLELV